MSSVNEQRVAGRMLDCEIAEKLFGYEWTIMNPRPDDELDRDLKIVRYLSQPGFIASFASWHHKPLLAAKGDEPISDTVPEYIPCYSTDIAAAFLVVEKVMQRFGAGLHYLRRCNPGSGEWAVCYCLDFSFYSSRGDTPSLAICKASLSIPSADRASQNEDK